MEEKSLLETERDEGSLKEGRLSRGKSWKREDKCFEPGGAPRFHASFLPKNPKSFNAFGTENCKGIVKS